MQDTQEELAQKVRDLQKEVEQLRSQLKESRSLLTWMNVPEAFEKESENKIPVLEEVRELKIHNDDGKPTHILIEGDNYHALTCLNYTHRGDIDVIYIDPPYNTGKKDDFIYNDARFLEEYPDGTKVLAEYYRKTGKTRYRYPGRDRCRQYPSGYPGKIHRDLLKHCIHEWQFCQH